MCHPEKHENPTLYKYQAAYVELAVLSHIAYCTRTEKLLKAAMLGMNSSSILPRDSVLAAYMYITLHTYRPNIPFLSTMTTHLAEIQAETGIGM